MKYINKLRYVIAFLALLFVTTIPYQVHAVIETNEVDTQMGTASEDIERAIAVGKTLVGKVDYISTISGYDGHGSFESLAKYKPGGSYGVDCSSFVNYMLYHGYGAVLYDSGNRTTTTWSMREIVPPEYVLTGLEDTEWKRGDIIMVSGFSHVIMWLGDGKYIASNGNPPKDTGGGPTVAKWWGKDGSMSNDMYVIRLPAKASDAVSKHPSKFKATTTMDVGDIQSSNPKDTDTEDGSNKKHEGSDAWKEPLIKFVNREYVINKKGLSNESSVAATPAIIISATHFARKLWEYSNVGVLIGGTALFFYMSILIIVYAAVLPRASISNGASNAFEKLSGTPAYYTREGLVDLLSKLGITIVVLAILYANAIPMLFSGIYEIVLYFV